MPLLSPPKTFQQALQQFDPLLRIRWSDRKAQWIIERRITRAKWVDPSRYVDHDTFVAARDGYIPVLYVGREQLDNRVFYTLWMCDVQRRGGAKRVANEMEAAEEAARKRQHAAFMDRIDQAARERYRYMNTVRTSDIGKDMSIVAGNTWT